MQVVCRHFISKMEKLTADSNFTKITEEEAKPMSFCSFCERKMEKGELVISVSDARDYYKQYYTLCSEKCKEGMYQDPEGGKPDGSVENTGTL
jgi:ribosomal protein L24E